MATMYRTGAVTHESDDTRPGKALCGRSIVGALNLSEMSGWQRVGFDAASNGPCANCSLRLQQLSVHPDRAIADAYREGWNRSARPSRAGLEWEEDHYGAKHSAAELDAWQAGWVDYASDYAYGTGITRPASVAPITVDNTPAGIFAAMMRANAVESTAPQSRLYGLLSDHLQRTLANTYGDAAPAVYGAIIRSGEASDDVVSGALADYRFTQAQEQAYSGPYVAAHIVIGADGTTHPALTAAVPARWTPMPCPRVHRTR